MKINRFFGIASLALVLSSSWLTAQYYHPVTVTGFTQDVIVNGVGSASTSTTSAVDDASFAYISRDFQATAGAPLPYYGLPVTGQFMTIVGSTAGLTYQLAPYSGNNSLKLSAANDTGTLTLGTPTAAYNLYFLATGGSGAAVASAVVTFSDNTTQAFSGLNVLDWYGGANAAIQGIGRVNLTTNNMEDGGGVNPRIYQIPLAISAANQSKTIQSVSFTKVSGTGFINIFGISADRYTTCLAPTAVTASAITFTTGTLSWTAPASTPSSYDVYYTSSTVAPNASTTPSQSGITATTAPMSGLTPQTRFHVWIRSNCSGNVGEWAYGTTFLTPCSTYNVPYSENFDTTAVGSSTNTNAPYCWSYLETSGFAGSGYVVATNPFVAPNSYVLANSSATTGNQMLVSPQTIALSDGTKRVRFYARGSSANYSLQVGTLTNPLDPTTFVAFNTTTLTNAHALYTVYIPAGGGDYLAFRHNLGGTSRSIYIDNITVEANPTCIEPANLSSSNVQAYTADIAWTSTPGSPANAPGSVYEYYYSTSNVAPTASTTALGSSSGLSASLSGLTPSSNYYLWLRSSCSATDKTSWLGPITFTTLCVPVTTFPWSENFDSMTAIGSGIVPNCWKQTLGGGSSNFTSANASQQSYNDPKSAPNYMTIYYPYNNPAYLWTPLFTLTAGTSYEFSFYWVGDNFAGWQNEVVVNNTQLATGSTSLTTFIEPSQVATGGGNSTNYTKVTVTYVPTATGNYTFAIKANNTTTAPFYMGFDDFSLTQGALATSEVGSDKKEIKISPNPFTDVIKISEFKDIKTVKIIDLAGRTLQTIENPGQTINLSSLSSGLYLVNMYFKDGSQKSVKVIKK
ncbi:choice-of-anchor J domain-containing protein [Chryseobacterium aahli]|uniref:T9SS-dependent choice-of-anchor J family protein n=1 Tax=Chryseobacterium aahli TaxID=1278643 RepID=UPI001F6200BE|nr:choice-of-anchor J domain-containing protein [Chryseobacterium aahli]MCI3939275.1 choice-of-anchor J domain-containing protein [Chryseobacterium aahli]